jgi:hypothetical protein
MKKLPLDQLQELARQLTVQALDAYVIPDEIREDLALMTLFEGDERVFVLYVPAEKRSESRDVAKARINAFTGEGSVEVLGLQLKEKSGA